jgi:hypothetical protein
VLWIQVILVILIALPILSSKVYNYINKAFDKAILAQPNQQPFVTTSVETEGAGSSGADAEPGGNSTKYSNSG